MYYKTLGVKMVAIGTRGDRLVPHNGDSGNRLNYTCSVHVRSPPTAGGDRVLGDFCWHNPLFSRLGKAREATPFCLVLPKYMTGG